jgi:hypothetical protein
MRRIIVAIAAGALLLPLPLHAEADQVEGCQAVNPGQPICTYTATESTVTPVSGVAGRGDWIVIVKRGKAKFTYKSPADGAPTATGFTIVTGDKITGKALTPGSGIAIGGG